MGLYNDNYKNINNNKKDKGTLKIARMPNSVIFVYFFHICMFFCRVSQKM